MKMKLPQSIVVSVFAKSFGANLIHALPFGREILDLPDLHLPEFSHEVKIVSSERDLKAVDSLMANGEYPWFSLLLVGFGHRYTWNGCAASLVSPEFILTSAGCINDDLDSAWIGALTSEPGNGGQYNEVIKIDQVFIHPNFNKTSYNENFALIKLASNTTIEPVNIESTSVTATSEYMVERIYFDVHPKCFTYMTSYITL